MRTRKPLFISAELSASRTIPLTEALTYLGLLPGSATAEQQQTVPPAGAYPGVVDNTQLLAGVTANQPAFAQGAVRRIILHSTGSTSLTATIAGWQSGTSDAHYVIDENGGANLIVPTSRRADHATIFNVDSIGIEHVNPYRPVRDLWNAVVSLRSSVAGAGALAAAQLVVQELDEFTLAPDFRARLLGDIEPLARQSSLASDDRDRLGAAVDTLHRILAANGGAAGSLYADISGAQKRTSYLLVARLARDLDLNLASLPGRNVGQAASVGMPSGTSLEYARQWPVMAHEFLQSKTLGEGENILWFLRARAAYVDFVSWFSSQVDRELANYHSQRLANPYATRVAPGRRRLGFGLEPPVDPLAERVAVRDRHLGYVAALRADRLELEPGPEVARFFYDQFWVLLREITSAAFPVTR